MAQIIEFDDGAQSETVPTIGNIVASNLVKYADDATYESSEQGAPVTGNIYYNTTDNVIRYYNGTQWGSLVDEETTQTLQSKSIDADTNTITNIDNDEIKVGAAIDVTKLHDGSVDNTEFGYLDGVTGAIQPQFDNKQDVSEKDVVNGYAGLDSNGRIAVTAMPLDALVYQGVWDASTNTPNIIDGIGDSGDYYRTNVAGSQNLGSGSQNFNIGDWVTYNGAIWERSDFGGGVDTLTTKADILTRDGSGLVRLPVGSNGQVLTADSAESTGLKWETPVVPVVPTIQIFTSGSGTYTTPAGALWIKIKMVGGGGGGAGSGTTSGTSAGAGTNTTFGTRIAGAGGGGLRLAPGGTPGTVAGSGYTILNSMEGGRGSGGSINPSTPNGTQTAGGNGGSSVLGPGGAAGSGGSTGLPAPVNSGGGGGGAGNDNVGNQYSGAGGGAGAYVELIITNPNPSYSYSVGAAGAGGGAGTSGRAGAAGGSGIIIVEEHY